MIRQTWYFGCLFLLFINVLFPLTSQANNRPVLEKEGEHLLVMRNNQLVFDAIEAEDETLEILNIKILEKPEFGRVKINDDYTLMFQPQPDICEVEDTFMYAIETSQGIDTVSVFLEILCEPLTVMSGFTPNGDGENDYFKILGVQNFPNNSLAIFNELGEEVYYKRDYENDWGGELADGTTAKDGIFYYVFHDGEDKYYSGYMKVN